MRRFTALMAALALAFAGCGDGDGATPAEEQTSTRPAAEESSTTTTTVVSEPDVSPGEGGMPPGAIEEIDPSRNEGTYWPTAEIARSGDDLWMRSMHGGEVALYRDGTWWRYPEVGPATFVWGWHTWDVAALPNGAVLATGEEGLFVLGDGGWEPHPALEETWVEGQSIAVDSDGLAWVSAVPIGDGLYRWDGNEMTVLEPSVRTAFFEDLAVTGDGVIWGASQGGDRLSFYAPATGAWGTEEVPVEVPTDEWRNVPVMSVDPDGDLWTVSGSTSESGSIWRVARRDTASGEWTVFDVPSPVDELGVVFPWSLAADDGGVWVTFEPGNGFRGELSDVRGVHRFDGVMWTSYLEDRSPTSVAVAGDGTVWAATSAGPVRVIPGAARPESLPEFEPGTVEVDLVTDLVYHEGDDRFRPSSGLTDVAAPASDGSWPVVVAFHGDPRNVSKGWIRPTALEIAEHGRVVFMPAWGHTSPSWTSEVPLRTQWEALTDEIACAVAYAKEHAADYGGDPDHITVYGFSAGGNASLMAGFDDSEPLEACTVDGSRVIPQAVVSADGDVLLGGGWDRQLAEDPEAFYALTPWRHLDPEAHPFTVHLLVTDTSLDRPIRDHPEAIFANRHVDVDLAGELDALGLIDDGGFSMLDSNIWAYRTLVEAGYDTHWLLLPDSSHSSLSPRARELLVDAVVHAEDPSS